MYGNNYCPGLTKSPYSHSNRWLEYLLEIEPGNFTDPQTSYMDIGYEYWKLITCQIFKFYTSLRRHLSNFHLQAAFKMRYLFSVSNPGILDKMKNWYKPEQVQSAHQSQTPRKQHPSRAMSFRARSKRYEFVLNQSSLWAMLFRYLFKVIFKVIHYYKQ